MKISVIVPAYNEEAYITNCLESLVHQQEQPDEIIVVNNNSTDKTVSIAKKYPIRIVNEKEQGMIQARNRGFNEAKYDIIARTDADTIVPTNWIKKIKKKFLNPKLVALSGPIHFYDIPEEVKAADWPIKKITNSYIRIIHNALKHDSLYGPNYSLRRGAWEKIKNQVCLNDKDVHEDIDLTIHLATLGKIEFDPSLKVESSIRRWKKPESYVDYIIKSIKSVNKHKPKLKIKEGNLIEKLTTKNFIRNFLNNNLLDK